MAEFNKIGLGTYKLLGDKCIGIISDALIIGYRTIDTAVLYNNHTSIKYGIYRSGISRKEIHLTSKINNETQKTGKIKESIDEILKELGTDYLDHLLLHSPIDNLILSSWKMLEEAYNAKKVLHIGVSNFESNDLDILLKNSTVKPYINQFEISPFNTRDGLVKYCNENNIKIQAYGSLTRNKKLNENKFKNICEKINKNLSEKISCCQILLKWALQSGYCVIPKTENIDHLRENLQCQNLNDINNEQIEELNELNINFYTIPKYKRIIR